MAQPIHEITERMRLQSGEVIDIDCKLLRDQGNIYAHLIYNSYLDGDRIFIPIKISRRWISINSIEDVNFLVGLACRLFSSLPTNHSYGDRSVYDPSDDILNGIAFPGKNRIDSLDKTLLRLLYDFYVSDPNRGITMLSIFMTMKIEQVQLVERLKYIQTREWIKMVANSGENIWNRRYFITPASIDKIEKQLKPNLQNLSRYFNEADIEHSGDFVFVIMPFREEEFDQTIYKEFIKPIVEKHLSIPCIRVDDDLIPERIDNKIFTYIKKSKFLIAEVTTNNANVVYELAMAHMLNKRVIILTQNDPPKLAFDFDKFPATIYANKEELKNILPDILKSTFKHS